MYIIYVNTDKNNYTMLRFTYVVSQIFVYKFVTIIFL